MTITTRGRRARSSTTSTGSCSPACLRSRWSCGPTRAASGGRSRPGTSRASRSARASSCRSSGCARPLASTSPLRQRRAAPTWTPPATPTTRRKGSHDERYNSTPSRCRWLRPSPSWSTRTSPTPGPWWPWPWPWRGRGRHGRTGTPRLGRRAPRPDRRREARPGWRRPGAAHRGAARRALARVLPCLPAAWSPPRLQAVRGQDPGVVRPAA